VNALASSAVVESLPVVLVGESGDECVTKLFDEVTDHILDGDEPSLDADHLLVGEALVAVGGDEEGLRDADP